MELPPSTPSSNPNTSKMNIKKHLLMVIVWFLFVLMMFCWTWWGRGNWKRGRDIGMGILGCFSVVFLFFIKFVSLQKKGHTKSCLSWKGVECWRDDVYFSFMELECHKKCCFICVGGFFFRYFLSFPNRLGRAKSFCDLSFLLPSHSFFSFHNRTGRKICLASCCPKSC